MTYFDVSLSVQVIEGLAGLSTFHYEHAKVVTHPPKVHAKFLVKKQEAAVRTEPFNGACILTWNTAGRLSP